MGDHLTTAVDHLTTIEGLTTAVDHLTTIEDHLTTAVDHLTTVEDHLKTAVDHLATAGDHLTTAADHLTTAADHLTIKDHLIDIIGDHLTVTPDRDPPSRETREILLTQIRSSTIRTTLLSLSDKKTPQTLGTLRLVDLIRILIVEHNHRVSMTTTG